MLPTATNSCLVCKYCGGDSGSFFQRIFSGKKKHWRKPKVLQFFFGLLILSGDILCDSISHPISFANVFILSDYTLWHSISHLIIFVMCISNSHHIWCCPTLVKALMADWKENFLCVSESRRKTTIEKSLSKDCKVELSNSKGGVSLRLP